MHGLINEKVTQATSVGPTQEAANASIIATAGKAVLHTGEMEKNEGVDVNTRSSSLSGSTVGLTGLSTAAVEATKSALLPPTTAPAEQLNMTIGEEVTQNQHQQPGTTFSSANTHAPTLAESSPQTTSVTELENTSELSPKPSSVFNSTATTNHTTSEAAPVFTTTSSPEMPLSTELSPSSQSDLAINNSVSTPRAAEKTESSSTSTSISISTDSPTYATFFSSSAVAIVIPRDKKIPPTKPAGTTAKAPREVSQSPSGTDDVQTCTTRSVVKHCLIIIACLAALSTIFIISTIALCMKLSSKKYKMKKRQQGTEMICISSLLPEKNYTYTRHRNPVSNGVLVLPGLGDSDDDLGDNLTLSSFLPENDRYV